MEAHTNTPANEIEPILLAHKWAVAHASKLAGGTPQMTIISAIVLLGVLIFVHELGHFLVAKWMGVKVEKFSLGFGPKIIGKTVGETEYLLCAVPLGGYVKMLGEDPEVELSEAEADRAFNRKAVWRRSLIVFSGPATNLIFAAFLFTLIFMTGVPAFYPRVGEVMVNTPAAAAGLINGDTIIAISDKPVESWEDMTEIIFNSPGRSLLLKVRRGGSTLTVPITPERKKVANIFGEEKERGLIGIKPSGDEFTKRFGPVDSVVMGVSRTWDVSALTVVSIVKLIERIIPANTIGGPIMIVTMAGEQASHGAMSFFLFMALISVNLGVINLFPIPILDGGHLLFFGIEAVRRKPLSERVMGIAQRIGLAFLLCSHGVCDL